MLLIKKQIDIALIIETHQSPRRYINIAGYTTHRSDHPEDPLQGCSAIIIRSPFLVIPTPTQLPLSSKLPRSQVSSNRPSLNIPIHNKLIYHLQLKNIFQSLGHLFVAGGAFSPEHPQGGSRLTHTSNPPGSLQRNCSRKNYKKIL